MSVPYLITQRKAAAASLFSYDGEYRDSKPGPSAVPPTVMVALVKAQNRAKRAATLTGGSVKRSVSWPSRTQPSAGIRLHGLPRESVTVEGSHLSSTSLAEKFKRTQEYKADHHDKMANIKTKTQMAEEMAGKLSGLLRQIAESRVATNTKQRAYETNTQTGERKKEENTAKVRKAARVERRAGERRKEKKKAREALKEGLEEGQRGERERMREATRGRTVVRRRSVASRGFPGTNGPANSNSPSKSTGRESVNKREEQAARYTASLREMHEVREGRRGMRTALSASHIHVDGGDIFAAGGSCGGDSYGDGYESGSFEGGSYCEGGRSPLSSGRPRSRAELLPASMMSAERVHNGGRVSPLQIPFSSTERRMDGDRSAPPRTSESGERETARGLISSPAPWSGGG